MPHWKNKSKPQRKLADQVKGSEPVRAFTDALNLPGIRGKWQGLGYPAFSNLGDTRLEITPAEAGALYDCELSKEGIGVSFLLCGCGELMNNGMEFTGTERAGNAAAYRELFAEAAGHIAARENNPPPLRRRRSERPHTESDDNIDYTRFILHPAG